MEDGMIACCICGELACSKVRKKSDDDGDDDDIFLYYCKDHLRGRRADKSFFD